MKIILVLISFISFSARANFKKLGNEFLLKNSSVKNSLGNTLKADQGIKLVESSLAMKVDGGLNYVDNDSDAANAVNFAAGKTTSLDLNFSKATSWGGVFSLNNSFEKVIQDPSRIIIFGGDPEIHQFKQTISFSTSLSRNLFGQEYKLSHYSSILNAEYIDLLSQNSVNDLFIQFSQFYARAVLHKKLYTLQQEALSRAKKRLALVRRRVSDGINLKADLLRAESAKIFQEEQLDQARQDFNQSLYLLSSLLHRNISIDEVGDVSSVESESEVLLSNIDQLEKNELTINSSKRFSDQQELDRDLKARQMLPELNFSVGYQTNDFDPSSSDVFKNGNLSGDRNTVSLGVTFSYNIGRVSERANLAQAEINHNQALHQLSAAYENNKNRKQMLFANIQLSGLNKKKAGKRVSLSMSIIQEYVKLFSLGRVTLDQVIQAEEDLINSQRRLAQQSISNFNQRLELAAFDYFLPDLISED